MLSNFVQELLIDFFGLFSLYLFFFITSFVFHFSLLHFSLALAYLILLILLFSYFAQRCYLLNFLFIRFFFYFSIFFSFYALSLLPLLLDTCLFGFANSVLFLFCSEMLLIDFYFCFSVYLLFMIISFESLSHFFLSCILSCHVLFDLTNSALFLFVLSFYSLISVCDERKKITNTRELRKENHIACALSVQ